MSVDFNKILTFAIHWFFAGFWAWFGFGLAGWVSHFIPALR